MPVISIRVDAMCDVGRMYGEKPSEVRRRKNIAVEHSDSTGGTEAEVRDTRSTDGQIDKSTGQDSVQCWTTIGGK